MSMRIKRRDVIALLGGTAMAGSPFATRAQQRKMPVIGLVSTAAAEPFAQRINSFSQGLKQSGLVEGQNVVLLQRWADGRRERVPGLVAELVGRQVNVLAAISTSDPARAAKAATSTIPIVFAFGGDPVEAGIVASLSRPDANLTGVTWLANQLQAKQLELLRELLPQAAVVGYLQNSANFFSEADARNMQAAGRTLGCEIMISRVAAADGIASAFADLLQRRSAALIVQPDPLFTSLREEIAQIASRHRVPVIYANSEFVRRGGLMSYSADINEAFRQAGLYVGRILKGEKPADLPVLQPTKFEFVINLKAAKALGITFPPSFHLRADEVIE